MTGTKGTRQKTVAVEQQHAVHGSNKRRARRDQPKAKQSEPDQTVNTATRCANKKGWMEWYSVGVQSSVTQKR